MPRDGLEAHPISRTSGQPGCSLFPGGGAVACFRFLSFFFGPGTLARRIRTTLPKPFPLLVQLEFGSFFSLPSAFCFLLLPHAAQSGRQAGSQLRVGVGDKRALPHTYIRQLRETPPNQSDGMDGCVRNASDAECGLTISLQRGRYEARQGKELS